MSRSILIVVSEEVDLAEKTKQFGHMLGVEVRCMTPAEYASAGIGYAINQNSSLGSPVRGEQQEAKILPFPKQGGHSGWNEDIASMEDVESAAIESAIMKCRGNLTEAAKALGIGRATLYRKVKQYKIDTSVARRRRAA